MICYLIVDVELSGLDLGVYGLSDFDESDLHIGCGTRGGLHEKSEIVFLGETLTLFSWDLPLRRQVRFVPNQGDHYIPTRIVPSIS